MQRDGSRRETLADIRSCEALWELRCGSTRCMHTTAGAAPASDTDASADPAPVGVAVTTAAIAEMC
jgi:hypothetical protein